MDEQKIQIRKIRDLGENISDTFQLLRQQWKPMARAFLIIAGIFLLAVAITGGLYQRDNFSSFLNAGSGNSSDPFAAFRTIFSPAYFLMILFGLLAIVAMNVVVASYLKLYESGIVDATVQQVWDIFKKYFLKCVLYYIPIFLLLIVGLVLCIIPGIYFSIVLMPFIYIVVTEDLSFKGAFDRCFQIIKQQFWPSFGIYIIMYIIVAFAATMIGFVVAGLAGLLSYFTTKEIASSVGIATSILNIFSYMFYLVFFISAGLQYYSLAERTDGTGIAKRIESIGADGTANSTIEEQF